MWACMHGLYILYILTHTLVYYSHTTGHAYYLLALDAEVKAINTSHLTINIIV